MKTIKAEVKEYKTTSGKTMFSVWVHRNMMGICGNTAETRKEVEDFARAQGATIIY